MFSLLKKSTAGSSQPSSQKQVVLGPNKSASPKKRPSEAPLTIREPDQAPPKKKSKHSHSGKGKEKVGEDTRLVSSDSRAVSPSAQEHNLSYAPRGLWGHHRSEAVALESVGEVTHSAGQFCPFNNVSINDRAGFPRPAREIVEKCVLPRDKTVLRQLSDEQIWEGVCMAQLAVSVLYYFLFYLSFFLSYRTNPS